MRQLLPHPADDVDLATAYAFPTGRTWVRANMVGSVDGAAAVAGTTRGLSGPADERAFAVLRQLADVLLVGAGTARAEAYAAEPVRAEHVARRRSAGQTAAPAMAVVSRSLDLDLASNLFIGAPTRTIVITCAAAPASRRRAVASVADVIEAGADEVDARTALDALHERGMSRVSCEGGPRLLGQLLAAERLDELCFTLAPLLAGGSAPRMLADHALDRPARLSLTQLLADDGFLLARYAVDRPAR